MNYDVHLAITGKIFRFENHEYKIISCGIEDNSPYVSFTPSNPILEERIKKELKNTGTLQLYYGHGYICFKDDYPQDKE